MITISKYHKKFNAGTINEVYALRGIDLTVNEGDFITIIGTNGSGKSTLLNAVAGVFLPDTGRITIAGNDVTRKKDFQRAKYISRVFQNPFMGTATDMTIAENLHMASLRSKHTYPKIGLNGECRKLYREEVRQLEMQLEDRLDNVIGSLSGGQRQALTLLMAIINQPKVLLLDEHTAALDPKSASQVIKLTRKFIEKDRLTSLMVTHSMQQALELGNRTIMMNKGEIIDDISIKDKHRLTVNDLLDKFAELRKSERLTDEMLEELRREYV
ncbi:MAG: ATP-binding cassette domain-containing protein [Candidatus Omnitrophota bacterium]|jgi:putative ABC transport system ATP-binding protein|nr:MAG: ATP-binding cassette domain-containing protein [Candidatus Omnitrophota bacterium]